MLLDVIHVVLVVHGIMMKFVSTNDNKQELNQSYLVNYSYPHTTVEYVTCQVQVGQLYDLSRMLIPPCPSPFLHLLHPCTYIVYIDKVYTDIVYTDIVYIDIVYTDIVYTDVVYIDIVFIDTQCTQIHSVHQGYNAWKVILEVYASFVLQCTVSGR